MDEKLAKLIEKLTVIIIAALLFWAMVKIVGG